MGKKKSGKVNTESVNAVVRTVINVSINVLVIAIFLIVLINFSGKAYDFGRAIFTEEALDDETSAKNVVVTIPKNSSNGDVAQIVFDEGLVTDKNVFLIKLMLSDYKDKVIPGTYTLSTGNTPEQIMEIISTEVVEEEEEKK